MPNKHLIALLHVTAKLQFGGEALVTQNSLGVYVVGFVINFVVISEKAEQFILAFLKSFEALKILSFKQRKFSLKYLLKRANFK